MRSVPFVLLLILFWAALISPLASADNTSDNRLYIYFADGPDDNCTISVLVFNDGDQALYVTNVTVVVFESPEYYPRTPADVNVTYLVFEGERGIEAGHDFDFDVTKPLPQGWDYSYDDWAMAFVNITCEDGKFILYNATSSIMPYSEPPRPIWTRDSFIPIASGSTFFLSLGVCWYNYRSERVKYDLWANVEIKQRRNSSKIKRGWFQFTWVDQGRAYILFALWSVVSLVVAILTYLALSSLSL